MTYLYYCIASYIQVNVSLKPLDKTLNAFYNYHTSLGTFVNFVTGIAM